jgi:uncharacterized protein YegL
MPIKLNNKQKTNIAILIDSSASMLGLDKHVVENYNSIIKTMVEKADELEQDVEVTLYTFGGTIDKVYEPTPVQKAPKLSLNDYRPGGGTPMFDCIFDAIEALRKSDSKDVANLITVITDGEENESRRSNAQMVRQSMDNLQATDRWTFTFLAPDARALTQLGIPSRNVQEWEASVKGLKTASTALSTGYASYLGLRANGQMSSKGFFLAAVDADKAAEAKKNLKNVAGDFYQFDVTRAMPIADFLYKQKVAFQPGRAFYQLTKKENVQFHKEVLLREKKSGKIYGGKDARAILGLPDGIDVKVTPATHGDWDIFVQSTSNNRKLVPDTTLLYLK